MFIVRYIAAAALVIWLGGLVLELAQELTDQALGGFHLIEYACGAVMLACFLAMKFLGPPPRAFSVRTAIVALMVLVAALSGSRRRAVGASANAVLGLVLLSWYARE